MVFTIKKIALDSSALLAKKNVLEEIRTEYGNKIEIVVPMQVQQELKMLAKKNERKIAIIKALEKQFGVKEKKVNARNADDALLALSQQGFFVLSLDQKLKKKIKEKKGKIIEVWGKNFFKLMET